MQDSTVEDSQIVPKQFDMAEYGPSPGSSQADHDIPDTQRDVQEAQPFNGHYPRDESDQESYGSRVDDTQFAAVEPETQGGLEQESLQSRVPETQFAGMEIDTQAMETQASPVARNAAFSPDTARFLQSASTDKPSTPPMEREAFRDTFLKRPVIHEANSVEGFRFGIAEKPTAGKYSGRPTKHAEGAIRSTPQQEATPMHASQNSQAYPEPEKSMRLAQPEYFNNPPVVHKSTPSRNDKALLSERIQHGEEHNTQENFARNRPSTPVPPAVRSAVTSHPDSVQNPKTLVPHKSLDGELPSKTSHSQKETPSGRTSRTMPRTEETMPHKSMSRETTERSTDTHATIPNDALQPAKLITDCEFQNPVQMKTLGKPATQRTQAMVHPIVSHAPPAVQPILQPNPQKPISRELPMTAVTPQRQTPSISATNHAAHLMPSTKHVSRQRLEGEMSTTPGRVRSQYSRATSNHSTPIKENARRIKQPFPEMQRASTNSRQQRTGSDFHDSKASNAPRIPRSETSNVPLSEVSSNTSDRTHAMPATRDNTVADQGQRPCRHPILRDQAADVIAEMEGIQTEHQDDQFNGEEPLVDVVSPRVRPEISGASRPRRSSFVEPNPVSDAGQPQPALPPAPVQTYHVNLNHATEDDIPFPPPPRASSQTPTEPRPQSRSNISTPMRPLKQNELDPTGISENSVLKSRHATKVRKSKEVHQYESPKTYSVPENASLGVESQTMSGALFETHPALPAQTKARQSPTASGFRNFAENYCMYENMVEEYPSMIALVKSQEQEIKRLNDLGEDSKKEVEALEAEKRVLAQKLQKYGAFHTKYKDHMNDVVSSQKALLLEAKEMRQISAQAITAYKTHQKQSVVDQMGSKIQEIKEMRMQADMLVKNEKAMLDRVAKAEETAETFTEDSLAKRDFETKLNDSLRTNKLLTADLERNLLELSREQHNSDQLHKQLTAQLEVHKDLMALLKKIPSDIVAEFTKDGSTLSEILNSESAIKAKLEEATNLVDELKKHEIQPPQSIIKLIEDIIESKVQASDSNGTSVQESVNELLENFKERLGQLKVDAETQNSLNDRISELRETNATLAAEMNARDTELQNTANQLEQAQQDLENCQSQLTSKAEELAAAKASPNENPELLAKVQEVENTNSELLEQLNSAKGDIAKAKEELKAARELSSSSIEQIRTLEGEVEDAQTCINAFEEERSTIKAKIQEEAKEKTQQIAQSADNTIKGMQTKYDSKVKNLTQKCSEMEAELNSAKDALERTLEEGAASTTNVERLQGEIASYKEQIVLQTAALKRLEDQQLALTDRGKQVNEDLASIGRDILGLQGHLTTTRNATAQDIDVIFSGQAELEQEFKKVDSLEQENYRRQEENSELQKKLETAEKENRENEFLAKARRVLEDEVATLRKQLHFATNSKVEALENEKSLLEKQNSDLQSQVQSLERARHKINDMSTNRAKSINRDNLQRPVFEQISREDDEILRGIMPSPEKMLRDAMKENNSNSTSMHRPKTSHMSHTHDSVLRTQSKTQQAFSNPGSRRTTSRQSNNDQQPQQPRARAPPAIAMQSTSVKPSSTPSSNPEQEFEPSSQASTRKVSARGHGRQSNDADMLLTPRVTGNPQLAASSLSAVRTSSVSKETSSVIKPFAGLGPMDESPLSDIEPMMAQLNSVNTQEELTEAYQKTRNGKGAESRKNMPPQEIKAPRSDVVIPDSQSFGAGQPFVRSSIPKSQQFSDADALPPTPKVKKTRVPTAQEESIRRRSSMPLKGVLKNSQSTPISKPYDAQPTSEASKSSYFQGSASKGVLQEKPSGLGKNLNQAQTSTGRSGYNRVVSGISANSKAGTANNTRGATASRRLTSNLPGPGANAPTLPGVPARNRKRSFEAKDESEKLSNSKKPRISLPHQASNRVIPDSQKQHI